jgi:hypothetical protein
MAAPLRLQAVTLQVPDLAAADPFYRWTFRLEPAPEPMPSGVLVLGWGREDRVRLVTPDGPPPASLSLRMPAMAPEDAVGWCRERELEIRGAWSPVADAALLRRLLPGTAVEGNEHPRLLNHFRLIVQGWADLPLELVFFLPKQVLELRGLRGPFLWRSEEWQGLETPGLLGVTLSGPDLASGRELLRRIGATPLDGEGGGDTGPLRIGDHQVILEERESSGVVGLAMLVGEGKLGEVTRTLSHLKVEFRQAGNRLLARDPSGRVVLVQGVRAA